MIKVDCEQLSDEWFALRAGIPTASSFDKIFTTKGAKSTQSIAYMNTLLAEWLTGEKQSIKQSDWMARGIEMEPEARSAYEFITDMEVEEVGLIFKDEDRLVSISPDGLTGDKGLEIKCPAPGTHVGYLLAQKLPTTYIQQVQGSMYVTGLEQWDFMSFHPDMPPVIITVDRDERLQTAIDEIMQDFIGEMTLKREKLNLIAA